jgi:hypothetical protein
MVQGQPGQKVHETLSQPIKAGHGGTHLSFQLWGKHKQEDHDPGQPEFKARPYLKNNQAKIARVTAQVEKRLPSKHEALNSFPKYYSTLPKKIL